MFSSEGRMLWVTAVLR